jgi:hypothetical protein
MTFDILGAKPTVAMRLLFALLLSLSVALVGPLGELCVLSSFRCLVVHRLQVACASFFCSDASPSDALLLVFKTSIRIHLHPILIVLPALTSHTPSGATSLSWPTRHFQLMPCVRQQPRVCSVCTLASHGSHAQRRQRFDHFLFNTLLAHAARPRAMPSLAQPSPPAHIIRTPNLMRGRAPPHCGRSTMCLVVHAVVPTLNTCLSHSLFPFIYHCHRRFAARVCCRRAYTRSGKRQRGFDGWQARTQGTFDRSRLFTHTHKKVTSSSLLLQLRMFSLNQIKEAPAFCMHTTTHYIHATPVKIQIGRGACKSMDACPPLTATLTLRKGAKLLGNL